MYCHYLITDIDGQKLALFLKISRNCVAMEITWEKIADTLEEFVDKRNLAQQIRTKFCRPPVEERFKCECLYVRWCVEPLYNGT